MDRRSDRHLHQAFRPLLAIWVTIGAGLVLWKGVLPAWETSGSDFAKYYTASRIVLDGEAFEGAYDDFIWFQKRMDRVGIEGQVGAFIPHPPPTALVMLPLARLDPLTAKRVWTALNVGFALLCVWLLSRAAGLGILPTSALFLGTGVGLVNNLIFGQLYLALLASLLAGVVLNRRRPLLAGLCFGVLAPVKYVGGLYLVSALRRREWRCVLGGIVSVSLVLSLSLWWLGVQPFETFLRMVLGSHLTGEIQDPFASRFQSWNSLFRRLFVADPIFNPRPALHAPFLAAASRNLVTLALAAIWLRTYSHVSLRRTEERELFRFGWIALGVLLLSPGGATYHFILLNLPTAFFCAISLRRGETAWAGVFALLHLAINFPLFLQFEEWTVGWWNVFGYTRLWLLTGFFALAVRLFGDPVDRPTFWRWSATVAAAALMATAISPRTDEPADGATRLAAVANGKGTPQLQAQPSLGLGGLVFYCLDLRPGSRAEICAADGRRFTPAGTGNWYGPDLGQDAPRLLAETVADGRSEIRVWAPGGDPAHLVAPGEFPRWNFDATRIAFVRRGEILVQDPESAEAEAVAEIAGVSGLAWAATGSLAVTASGRSDSTLDVLEPSTGVRSTLMRDGGTIRSPNFSPDGRTLLFSWRREGNRDIWAIDVASARLTRLTHDPANDDHPVWDAANQRIIFSTDRGRGLGFTTLFWLPLPAGLR